MSTPTSTPTLNSTSTSMSMPILSTIEHPAQIRKFSVDELETLANELRTFILESVAQTGGHLSSNLGTVELTIALHHVFNTPDDRLIWDVGHQSYPHKILTGRRDQMSKLRQHHGLSGFPKRSESEFDCFGTAHSSTSISAALGMAKAAQILNQDRVAIAVIGDGAMSAGMAFEAMNNAGDDKGLPLLIILNDNDMSISPAVGALNKYLSKLLSGRLYNQTRRGISKILDKAPSVKALAQKFEEHAKGMLTPATLFEELGFNYIGPIDGHHLPTLIETLSNMQQLLKEGAGPLFLHVITKKGQGYKLAENNPILYHGPGKFNVDEGIVEKPAAQKTFTQIFSDWICDMAAIDERLVAITPAMREGSGLLKFEETYPKRYFDVGIAEQHALTFAAGLACEGLKPVVAIYSTFLQRAYDQLIHDVALQKLPMLLAIDRAGLVGADGATHAGNYDIAYLRCIPNVAITTPSDENELRQMLYTAYQYAYTENCVAAVRYPRGAGIAAIVQENFETLPWGRAKIVQDFNSDFNKEINEKKSPKIAILAFGPILHHLQKALQNSLQNKSQNIFKNMLIADMRFVKPLDLDLMQKLCDEHVSHVITIEDSAVQGGAGSACLEALAKKQFTGQVLNLGLPDLFIDQGEVAQLWQEHGLGMDAIIDKIINFIEI